MAELSAVSSQLSDPEESSVQDFRNLKVWQKAHELTLHCYQLTRSFPREELFGLTSQMRRASVSVPSNIAEGCGRGSDPDFARLLTFAQGSASELEYQALLANDLGLLTRPQHERFESEVVEVKKMLGALSRTVRQRGSRRRNSDS